MKHYWQVVRNHKRPGRFIAARLLMATGLCNLLQIKQRGFKLRFHNSNLAHQLWIDPDARLDSLAFFRDYIKDGDRIVDVGANVGDTVLTASLPAGPTGHVIGIEAHPRTFAFLQDNIRLNAATNVTLIHSAVGSACGTINISDGRRDDMNRVGGGGIRVPMEQLDVLVSGKLPVALLKVDVEGYEKNVFEGATDLLRRTQCVFFEVSSLHFAQFGYTTRDLLTLLVGAGFRLYRIAGPKGLQRISVKFDTAGCENLVGLRDDAEFRRRTGWIVASPGALADASDEDLQM